MLFCNYVPNNREFTAVSLSHPPKLVCDALRPVRAKIPGKLSILVNVTGAIALPDSRTTQSAINMYVRYTARAGRR